MPVIEPGAAWRLYPYVHRCDVAKFRRCNSGRGALALASAELLRSAEVMAEVLGLRRRINVPKGEHDEAQSRADEKTVNQLQIQAIPDDHPLVPQLNQMFGEHSYFLDQHGLN